MKLAKNPKFFEAYGEVQKELAKAGVDVQSKEFMDMATSLPEMVSVPQALQHHRLDEPAFLPAQQGQRVKIRFTTHKSEHLIVDPANLTVWNVLCAIHEYLHTTLSRASVVDMGEARRRAATQSFNARRNISGSRGMQMLDIVGFGARTAFFNGLFIPEGAETNTWSVQFCYGLTGNL
uniref:DUF6699 domain-containing protein n=1 Tax=Mycena chlorophos TaxID=658473 RepID=A0ABQ0LS53_MYCCL|nr:predicted protein [Mycena chlorophos]